MSTRFSTLLLALSLVAATAAAAAPPKAPAPLPSREERLVNLARLWGQVRYRHPALAYKDINWDGALVAAIPQVEAAKDRAAYAAAVQDMLDVLRDPLTRVERDDGKPGDDKSPAPAARELRSWEGKDVLVLDLRAIRGPADASALRNRPEELRPLLSRAKAVIIDVRTRGKDATAAWYMSEALGSVLPLLLNQELQAPGTRRVLHSGFRAQRGGGDSHYSTSLLSSGGEVVLPKGDGKTRQVLLLVDDASSIDPRVLAMKAQGLAQIISEGRPDDGAAVERTQVELGAGLKATVRLSELTLPVRADAVVPRRTRPDAKDEAFQKALELARKPVRKVRARAAAELPSGRWEPDRGYEDMLYPGREYRLLALFRLWNVIHFFYPYKHLLDRDWDTSLASFIPKFEGARNAAEYALAVAELSTLVQDGHTSVRGHPELEKRGLAGVGAPFTLMELEGKPVVVKVRDAEAAPGLAPGQVVESLDGKPFEERVKELSPYVTASHEVHRRYLLLSRAVAGPEGSQGTLGVRDASGQLKQVRFTRSTKGQKPKQEGEPYRLLAGNIGYVDLTRLQVSEVEGMFEKLKDTKALVFDMRGYPQGTAWSIAPHLNTFGARYGAVFERNLVSGEAVNGRFKFLQELPTAPVPLYRGKTVMLIDERAMSQAEHTGLFFGAANGTTFIGTPSAGANGDVTNLVLPGGIIMTFTGHDVRYVDGRQLQRVGLRPHVYVRPTLAGLRAGQDEVLDRALEHLNGTATANGATR